MIVGVVLGEWGKLANANKMTTIWELLSRNMERIITNGKKIIGTIDFF